MAASVEVRLDTEAPTLAVQAPAAVDAPQDWVLEVTASKPLGHAAAAVRDVLGGLANLGVERTGPRTFRVVVPTPALPSGTLLLWVADEVLNAAQVAVPLEVARPRYLYTTLTLSPAFEIALYPTAAYDTALALTPAFETELEID